MTTKKLNKIQRFLYDKYPEGSYNHVLKTFLKKRSKHVSHHTTTRFFYSLQPIGEILGNPRLSSIKRSWLKKYIVEKRLLSAPDTMRTTIADIKFFFTWSKAKGHHSKNIGKLIKPMSRRRSKQQKAASEDSMEKVMKSLAFQLTNPGLVFRNVFDIIEVLTPDDWLDDKKRILRDLFILTFLYETGARVGELCSLGSKAINDAIQESAPAYHITVVGKTNDRDYLFTERTAELWKMWQLVRPDQYGQYAVVGWRSSRPIAPLRSNGVSEMLVRRCQSLELKPFRSHAIRHAKIKRSRQIVGIEIASMLVDHSKLDTTWGYANIDEDELIKATIATGLKINLW